MSPSVSVAIAAVTLAEVEDQTHFTRRKSGTGAVRVWGPGHSPRIHSLSWQVQGPSEELLRHARPGVQSASLRARDPGRGHVGETVIASLGSRPLGPWRSQRVSGWLAAVLQPRPGGKPILVAGTRGPYSQHLRALPHGSSLQIRPWRLQDSGPCRARITLHTCPVNTTKDFTLRVYEKLREPNITASSRMAREGSATSPCHAPWPLLGRGGGTTLSVTWTSGVSNSYRCSARNRSRRAPALSPPGPSAKTPTSLLSAQKLHVASLSLELQGLRRGSPL
ncbi:T-lymphocyte surface antigen Ly-9-like isoform X2 [Suricata suricatta]|uniref:T-lymphocyte surface antigen Ly-9-like isoform X2 n=1 Tax=Suricata suricatta TaxID=37032 RepID=UPI00115546ED|nr:T-lymphocyte surface antigen Ly-9-like isoform X2 [Suricata suricatta]